MLNNDIARQWSQTELIYPTSYLPAIQKYVRKEEIQYFDKLEILK